MYEINSRIVFCSRWFTVGAHLRLESSHIQVNTVIQTCDEPAAHSGNGSCVNMSKSQLLTTVISHVTFLISTSTATYTNAHMHKHMILYKDTKISKSWMVLNNVSVQPGIRVTQ